ncbi:hypothetical protein WMY93_014028 [Mugilogobius chulae]|uniref:Uncharacterized protein n=1 Tax=Mugilogobius chulae TaxID=88201 RepID=A0AAW0NUF9_9GOBI
MCYRNGVRKDTRYFCEQCQVPLHIGGTIDITVHEVVEGGKLIELHKASGNDRGGRRVDKRFTQCMRQFFCDGLWEDYEKEHPDEVQKFMDDLYISVKPTSLV